VLLVPELDMADPAATRFAISPLWLRALPVRSTLVQCGQATDPVCQERCRACRLPGPWRRAGRSGLCAGRVLATGTVKDLVAGSGIAFADRGMRPLKGLSDQWRLFSVTDT
jgi:hypothetical protein